MTLRNWLTYMVPSPRRLIFLLSATIALLTTTAAHSQTTKPSPSPPLNGSTAKAGSKAAEKSAASELPPPEPAGATAPLPKETPNGRVAPNRNPFPTSETPLAQPGPQPAANTDQPPTDEPGYFGAITDDRQKSPGVRVVEVVAGGPAELAGLRVGDLITSVNDQPIREMADLAKVITTSQAGQTLKITYQRGASLNAPGQSSTLDVTLGARPAEHARLYRQFGRIDDEALPQNEAERPAGMLLGLRTAPLEVADQSRLGAPVRTGAMVLDVVPGSPAELAGIPRDAVIISVNGLLVDSPDALTREVLQAGSGAEIELGYYLGRDQIKRRIVLGGAPPINHAGDVPVEIAREQEVRIEQLEQQVEALQRRLNLLEQQLQQ